MLYRFDQILRILEAILFHLRFDKDLASSFFTHGIFHHRQWIEVRELELRQLLLLECLPYQIECHQHLDDCEQANDQGGDAPNDEE